MQQTVYPVLKPLQRPQVLQTDLELHLQLHRHIEKGRSKPCSDGHAYHVPQTFTAEALWCRCTFASRLLEVRKAKAAHVQQRVHWLKRD